MPASLSGSGIPGERSELSIRVPATSANLGPGFDVFGLAVDLYSDYRFVFTDAPGFELLDADGGPLPIPPEHNLIARAYEAGLDEARALGDLAADDSAPAGFRVYVDAVIKPGSGYGSSASALVAGLAAARHVAGLEDSDSALQDRDVQLLNRLEGHPDNVAPARLGGFVICYTEGRPGSADPLQVRYLRKSLPEDLGLAAIIADYSISTEQSRSLLPARVSIGDCLSNMKGAVLWLEYIQTGNPEFLQEAISADRLHEPYRIGRLPALGRLLERRDELGLYGATISGSGPGLLLYFPRSEEERILARVDEILDSGYGESNERYRLFACRPDYSGLQRLAPATG